MDVEGSACRQAFRGQPSGRTQPFDVEDRAVVPHDLHRHLLAMRRLRMTVFESRCATGLPWESNVMNTLLQNRFTPSCRLQMPFDRLSGSIGMTRRGR